jgi:hypothetical protein
MKPKKFGLMLIACASAIAFTLSAASALTSAASALTSATSPAEQPATSPNQYAQYRNDQWHFSIAVPSNLTVGTYDRPGNIGQTIQFSDASASNLLQITAEPYADLDVALGEEGAASNNSDQPDTLGIVHVYHDDLLEITFVKNGIAYVVQSLPENATFTLEILRTWHFI